MHYLTLNYYRIIDYLEKFKSENLGLYFSFFLHFLILLSMIGLPNFFGSNQIVVPTIIPIEIINVSNVTSVSKKNMTDTKNIETKKVKVQVKEKKFNSSDNQEIKKIEIKEKLKIKEKTKDKKIFRKEKEIEILEDKKDIPIELEKKKIEINTNNFESLPTKKIKPKLKPKSDLNKKELFKTQKSDVIIDPKPKPKVEPEFNIASMLKDLRNEKTSKNIEKNIKEKSDELIEKLKEEENTNEVKLSISEIDLVLQQLSRCFIAPAGAEIKKTMFVKISAKIQPNREVYENSIRIVDTNISKSSPVYGPITESAMRTLLNPDCTPLKLPEEKYDQWKNLTMKFDYSIMRGN